MKLSFWGRLKRAPALITSLFLFLAVFFKKAFVAILGLLATAVGFPSTVEDISRWKANIVEALETINGWLDIATELGPFFAVPFFLLVGFALFINAWLMAFGKGPIALYSDIVELRRKNAKAVLVEEVEASNANEIQALKRAFNKYKRRDLEKTCQGIDGVLNQRLTEVRSSRNKLLSNSHCKLESVNDLWPQVYSKFSSKHVEHMDNILFGDDENAELLKDWLPEVLSLARAEAEEFVSEQTDKIKNTPNCNKVLESEQELYSSGECKLGILLESTMLQGLENELLSVSRQIKHHLKKEPN